MNKEKIKQFKIKVRDYLFDNIDKFEFVENDTHYAVYKFDDEFIKIWSANGESSVSFYQGYMGIELFLYDDKNTETEAEKNRKKILWKLVERAKTADGDKRKIEMTQLSNDLFFRFKGVFKEIKFTGYNDTDWWTKYKPTEIKEDDEITWTIDLEKMEAVYKPKIKN